MLRYLRRELGIKQAAASGCGWGYVRFSFRDAISTYPPAMQHIQHAGYASAQGMPGLCRQTPTAEWDFRGEHAQSGTAG
jgi:hypothetical protein